MTKLYRTCGKRILDVVFAAVLLAVLSPLFLYLALLVLRGLGAPILYKQDRPGKDARIFALYKFRTMKDLAGADGEPLPDAERMTAFGEALRRSSLDELPELVNILRGDMSFVGPRPLLVRYLPRYSAEQRRRHEVKPGLTGLAQIKGRNAIDWRQKFEYDVAYVDGMSFRMDMEIIFSTIKTVLKREGIAENGEATMSEFMGN